MDLKIVVTKMLARIRSAMQEYTAGFYQTESVLNAVTAQENTVTELMNSERTTAEQLN